MGAILDVGALVSELAEGTAALLVVVMVGGVGAGGADAAGGVEGGGGVGVSVAEGGGGALEKR